MPPFTYRCPHTGYRTQGFLADEASNGACTYESVLCTVCQRIHFVNPATGAVLGEKSE
jgi:hypothetical protein